MTTRDPHPSGHPDVSTVLLVRDDETGWAHVAYDIDPRRRPRCAGFIHVETEHALVRAMDIQDFRLAAAYRVEDGLTAFLFGRAATSTSPPPTLVSTRTGADAERA